MLAKLLSEKQYPLAFNLLELGALPIGGEPEPFHALLGLFPSSRIAALEIDPAVCEDLNRKAPQGMRFYPCAIGRTEESRTLYETVHPMCASLYEPDERYAELFNNLDVMRLTSTREIRTISLDAFAREHAIGRLDFIKMDIQGAALDVLRGGGATLGSVLAIVSEVEFVPLYKGQPLYGDIDAHLRERNFMLHKFLGMAGRVMKPLAAHGTGTYPVQMMWTDALFTRDILTPSALTQDELLKLAVLLDLYDSKDAALYLLRHHESLRGSALARAYFDLVMASGVWTEKKQR